MAREGVSYESVKAAAEQLVGEGRAPSIRAVRERLRGTGSPNTIHRHLTKWREARPEAPAASTDLPQSIVREINGESQRAVSAARAEVEAQLAQAQTEAADLAASGEALEAERDTLTEQVAALTSERDVLAGKAAEQAAEIAQAALREVAELRARADKSAEAAHATAGDVARLQEALTRVSGDTERLRSETTQLRDQLNASNVENARLNGLLGREAAPNPPAAPAPGTSTRTKKPGG